MGLAWDASLTDAGVSMISQWAQGAGDKLTITKAVIGEGIVAANQLHLLTQLTDEKSTISIQGFESVANGVKLKLKKTSQGITTSFTLNQIGVYAKLDTSGGTPIIAESLIGVYQQDTGVLIPTEAEAPDFAFTFYGTLQTNYSGDLTINVDTSALLSQDDIADDLVTADATMALSANMGKKLADHLSHENLLDNPWFTVNQRGQASYSTPGDYTADRWYMPFGGLTVGISSSGATLTATGDTVLDQKFETDELKGKTVTLSIMHFDGTIEQGTVQFPSTAGTTPVVITGGELQAGVDTYGNCYFRIYIATGNTITARAIKLELGSVSTLANDVEPDYALELAKCRASTADPSDTYANKGNLVNYADLTTIHATGSTNTTGAQIDAGTFFYLNGTFCKALTNIAVNATFTLNTNLEVATVGGEISSINDNLSKKVDVTKTADITINPANVNYATTLYKILQQINFAKLTPYSMIIEGDSIIYRIAEIQASSAIFSCVHVNNNLIEIAEFRVEENNNGTFLLYNGAESNFNSTICTNTMKLYY